MAAKAKKTNATGEERFPAAESGAVVVAAELEADVVEEPVVLEPEDVVFEADVEELFEVTVELPVLVVLEPVLVLLIMEVEEPVEEPVEEEPVEELVEEEPVEEEPELVDEAAAEELAAPPIN